jgi:hypothetical protein
MDFIIPQDIIDLYDTLDEGELCIELYHSGKYYQYESFKNCLNYIYKYKNNNFDEFTKWVLPIVNEKCRKIIYNMVELLSSKR